MEYRNLGKWGLKLSTIGLGSYLTIGMHVDDETAAECVKVAFEGGINWIDTANAYNRGQAEIALGRSCRTTTATTCSRRGLGADGRWAE